MERQNKRERGKSEGEQDRAREKGRAGGQHAIANIDCIIQVMMFTLWSFTRIFMSMHMGVINFWKIWNV